MKKNLFNYLLVLCVFVLFLTGCKKDNSVVLTFSSWGSASEMSILKPVLKEFERKNPDIKINFLHFPQNYFQKIHLLFASNTAPDVVFINNLSLPIYADFLDDLSGKINTENFYPKSLEVLSYNGKLLAVPRDVSNLVIYYNKDVFDKFGVPYPKSDWTFEDFTKMCEKFKENNTFCISYDENTMYLLPFLMSSGEGILSDDLKTEIFSESDYGLNFYKNLRYKYHYAPEKSESATSTMAQMFLNKKLAMHLSGRWIVPKYRESADFRWDVINFPNGKEGSIVPADASGWAVYKYSKHKNEAIMLIEYLSSKEVISKIARDGLIVPARNDVAESDVFLSGKPENSKTFVEIIENSKKTPVNPDYKKLTDKIDKILSVK